MLLPAASGNSISTVRRHTVATGKYPSWIGGRRGAEQPRPHGTVDRFWTRWRIFTAQSPSQERVSINVSFCIVCAYCDGTRKSFPSKTAERSPWSHAVRQDIRGSVTFLVLNAIATLLVIPRGTRTIPWKDDFWVGIICNTVVALLMPARRARADPWDNGLGIRIGNAHVPLLRIPRRARSISHDGYHRHWHTESHPN